MRILTCVLFGLGDAIMVSPMLRAIKEQIPDCELHAVSAMSSTAEYIRGLPYVDSVQNHHFLDVSVQEKHAILDRYRRERFDYVLVPYPAGRWQYHAAALYMGAGRVLSHIYWKWQYGALGTYHFLTPVRKAHQVEVNGDLLAGLGLPAAVVRRTDVAPGWRLTRSDEKRVALHLTSLDSKISKGNHLKAWPLNKFVSLAQWLHDQGYEVLTVGAGAELEIAEHFEKMCGFDVPIISGTLEQTAQALSQMKAVVSNDSGIAHLSAALGVPTLTLFAMTDPAHLAPVGPGEYIRSSSCAPCFTPQDRKFHCPRNVDFACIRRDLTLEHVTTRLSHLLNIDALSVR